VGSGVQHRPLGRAGNTTKDTKSTKGAMEVPRHRCHTKSMAYALKAILNAKAQRGRDAAAEWNGVRMGSGLRYCIIFHSKWQHIK